MRALTLAGSASYFLIGLATVIFGALLPEILHYYGQSYSGGGELVFAQFAGFLVGVLTSPVSAERLGYRGALFLSVISFSAAQLALALRPSWHLVVLLAAVNGFGFGMTQTVVGTLILESTERAKAVAMSRLEVFFGLGALLMPVVASLLIAIGAWNVSFAILGFGALSLLVVWGRKPWENAQTATVMPAKSSRPQTGTAAGGDRRGGLPLLALFIGLIMMYVGVETSIINFLPSILIRHIQLRSSVASLSVTAFWGAMTVGRIFAGAIAEKLYYSRYLLWSNFGTLAALAGIAVMGNVWGVFILVLLLGLMMSGMFSISLVFANHVVEGTAKKTTSILIASGGIGGSLFPLLMGWSMDRLAARGTIWILTIFTFLMLLLLVAIARISKLRGKKAVPQTG